MSALTTHSQIEAYRLATLRSGLKLEIKGIGRSKGRTCYAILKDRGYTGTREQVLEQVQQDLNKMIAEITEQH